MNILWDFDGTLFDTYPAYTDLISQVLGETIEKQEIYEKLKVSFSHAVQFYNLSNEQAEEIQRGYNTALPIEMKPFSGVEEVLKFADKNVIVTHKHREGVDAILRYYGFEPYFTEIITIDDGFPRKPDPAAYQFLHEKHGIDLAIGDRELDLLPAKELGISTCNFQNDAVEADYHLQDYEEFFQVIKPEIQPRSL